MKISQAIIETESTARNWQIDSSMTRVTSRQQNESPSVSDSAPVTLSEVGLSAMHMDTEHTAFFTSTLVGSAIRNSPNTTEFQLPDSSSNHAERMRLQPTGRNTPHPLDSNSGNTEITSNTSGLQVSPKLMLMIAILESLTHRQIKINGIQTFTPAEVSLPEAAAFSGSSITITTKIVRESFESFGYRSHGSVTTTDGREISFALDLDMQRYTYEESTATLQFRLTPRVQDPLVLNLATDRVGLNAQEFGFDLNADEIDEKMSRLSPGSTFLAIDRNGNGRIDDGSELFGAHTGNGFAELALLDSDTNGWIDENDPLFYSLLTWRPDEALQSLQDAGVGAIFLGQTATPFTLRHSEGETAGFLRSTGIFLTEDGQARTIQQIDMVI